MIGIVFATQKEADPFLRQVEAQKKEEDRFPCFIFVSKVGSDGVVLISGIGKNNGRAAADHLMEKYSVSKIINAGIAGAAVDGIPVGSLFCISEVRDGDETEKGVWKCSNWNLLRTPRARLTTFEKPVFDLEKKQSVAHWGELIDMEGGAVAQVCHKRGVECVLLKGVSDFADEKGRDSLQKNLGLVSQQIADKLVEILFIPA